VRTWLNEAVAAAAGDAAYVLPQLCYVHALPTGIPLNALQSLMGHKSMKSTEVYAKVFSLDVAASHRVQFHMPGNEAVAMLKRE